MKKSPILFLSGLSLCAALFSNTYASDALIGLALDTSINNESVLIDCHKPFKLMHVTGDGAAWLDSLTAQSLLGGYHQFGTYHCDLWTKGPDAKGNMNTPGAITGHVDVKVTDADIVYENFTSVPDTAIYKLVSGKWIPNLGQFELQKNAGRKKMLIQYRDST